MNNIEGATFVGWGDSLLNGTQSLDKEGDITLVACFKNQEGEQVKVEKEDLNKPGTGSNPEAGNKSESAGGCMGDTGSTFTNVIGCLLILLTFTGTAKFFKIWWFA